MAKKEIGAHSSGASTSKKSPRREKPSSKPAEREQRLEIHQEKVRSSGSGRVVRMNQTEETVIAPVRAKTKKKVSPIYNILIAVCAVIFIGSLGVLGYQLWGYHAADQVRNDLQNLVTVTPAATPEEKATVDYSKLYEQNKDFVGWLKIDDTKIDYPVVKAADNDKYLHTNFYGESQKLGTVFADYRNELTEEHTSDNTVLYGHSAANGSYFAAVRKYKSLDYYKEHPFVSFNTMYSVDDWVIMGAIMIDALDDSDTNFMYQNALEFASEDEYNAFMEQINKRNYFNTGIDCKYGDKFLTLSTCDYDFDESRFVLFARKLREGETKESFDFSSVTENTGKVMPARWS